MPATDTAEFVLAKVDAQRSSTLIQVGALLAAAACIAGAAMLQPAINKERKELQLVVQSDLYKELPPEYAWVSAAGGTFRGIAADVLWMRAEQLKVDGKYFELHQLAKWICTLQPRFATVWDFQSWNMSYNISVGTHTAQERWQWVYNGIRLLRDEGIPNNERVVSLYHRLANIFYHKIGDRQDDFHNSYKQIWAATMDILLGAPPGGATNAEAIDWFRPVAQAPHTLAELVAAHPGVQTLVDRLDSLGIDVNEGTSNRLVYHPLEEKFFRKHKGWEIERSLSGLRKEGVQVKEEDRKIFEFFDKAPKADLDSLLAFLRAKVLREQYKMDPQYMLELTGRLGTDEPIPLDWRTPWAHSIYWAMYGGDKWGQVKGLKEFDLLSADRILLFSLKQLARMGRYVFRVNLDDPMHSFLTMMPDLRYIEAMHKKYLELGARHMDPGDDNGPAGETLRSGHVNELSAAVTSLYLAGRVDEARNYLLFLAANYKDQYTKEVQELYLQSVDQFVQRQLMDQVDNLQDAIYMIYSLLNSGYMSLGNGSADEFAASVRNAALVYERFQKDKLTDREARRTLPPFAQVRAGALAGFLQDYGTPVSFRAMVYNREQNDVRLRCYDLVIDALTAQCEKTGLDVAKVFPPPAGLEQWRKDHPKPETGEDVVKKNNELKEKKRLEAK
jgi:hypothetical protein